MITFFNMKNIISIIFALVGLDTVSASPCQKYAKAETANCDGCTSITSGKHGRQEYDGCKWNPNEKGKKRCSLVRPGIPVPHGTYYPGFSPFKEVSSVCPYPDKDLKAQDQAALQTAQEEADENARKVLQLDENEPWDHHCKDRSKMVSPFLSMSNADDQPLCHFSDLGINVDNVDSSMRVFVRLPIGLRLINCYSPDKETKRQFRGTLAMPNGKVTLKGQGYNQGRPAKTRTEAYGAVWFTPSAANYRHTFCGANEQFQEYIVKVPIVVEFNSWKRDKKTHQMGGTNVGDGKAITDKEWETKTVMEKVRTKNVETNDVDVGYHKWSGIDFTGAAFTAAGGIRNKGGSGYLACRECEIVLATKYMNEDYLDISIHDKNFGEWTAHQVEYTETETET